MDNKNNNLIEPIIFDNPELRSKFINHTNQKNIASKSNELIKPMDFDIRTKSFEEKTYIILYRLNSNEDDDIYRNIYAICIGRTEAYNDIKEKLLSGLDIDIHRSRIMTETKQTVTDTGDRKYFMIPYEELISIYSFCISIKEYYSDDVFDIEDYNDTDAPSNDDTDIRKGKFLSPEQIAYRDMLEQSMSRNKFIASMREELGITDGYNI